MKRWLIPAVVLLVLLVAAAAVVAWLFLPSELPATTGEEDVCARYGIHFDQSSVLSIYENPGAIAGDPERFWQEDPAYRQVAMAPMHWGASIPPDGWVAKVERVLAIAEEERKEEKPFAKSMEIIDHADTFCENALPVIAGLLPDEADLGTTVYLTAFSDPSAFAYRSNVVMNVELGRVSRFFHILGHEVFHIGYFNHQPYQTEVWSDFYPTQVYLTTLQNDGLAVYTQYLLYSYYPAPAEMELILLESKPALKLLTGRVNRLLQETAVLSEAEILGKAFRGVNQRALYVVGAHMARTIDESLGRDALVETVRQGPRSFVVTYNRVAEEGMEIYVVPEPEELSTLQVLRRAALQGDVDLVADTVAALAGSGIENPGGETFEHLTSAGLILLRDGKPDLAVEVYQLMVSLFPEHPYAYLNLGDAYTQQGSADRAQEAYARALEIDPRVAPAISR
jgi:tetratricopeptide (TPR) repeat protein